MLTHFLSVQLSVADVKQIGSCSSKCNIDPHLMTFSGTFHEPEIYYWNKAYCHWALGELQHNLLFKHSSIELGGWRNFGERASYCIALQICVTRVNLVINHMTVDRYLELGMQRKCDNQGLGHRDFATRRDSIVMGGVSFTFVSAVHCSVPFCTCCIV